MRLLQRLSITTQFVPRPVLALLIMGAGTGATLNQSYRLDLASQKASVLAIGLAACYSIASIISGKSLHGAP